MGPATHWRPPCCSRGSSAKFFLGVGTLLEKEDILGP